MANIVDSGHNSHADFETERQTKVDALADPPPGFWGSIMGFVGRLRGKDSDRKHEAKRQGATNKNYESPLDPVA